MEYRFSDANKALTVITTMQQADVPRANNRARIDLVFNGNEPYTPAEVQQGRIDTNVNFLEGPNIAHSSRLKLYTALLGDERLFNIKFDQAPPEMKGLWEEVISEEINRKIKSKLCYFEEQRNKIASLVLHGVAPMVWSTEDCWYPKFASLEDWKVPGRTLVTLENMDYYAVYRRYTPYELYCKVFGEYAMAGWNK